MKDMLNNLDIDNLGRSFNRKCCEHLFIYFTSPHMRHVLATWLSASFYNFTDAIVCFSNLLVSCLVCHEYYYLSKI